MTPGVNGIWIGKQNMLGGELTAVFSLVLCKLK